MIDNDRDNMDDLFRSKLYDFESETMPDDWDLIASRLPDNGIRSVRHVLRYWIAAAVISLLILTSGLYLFNAKHDAQVIVESVQSASESVRPVETISTSTVPVKKDQMAIVAKPTVHNAAQSSLPVSTFTSKDVEVDDVLETDACEIVENAVSEKNHSIQRNALTKSMDAENLSEVEAQVVCQTENESTKPKLKRWGFGMGAGSISAGSSNSINTYAFKNTTAENLTLMQYNSPYFNDQAAKTNIKHKMPVSFGMGVSYALTNRFSIQSGLSYSYLSSSWETNGAYYGKTKQKLHYLGIPLSLNYAIASWQNLQWYASAGTMAEMNVAGKLDTKLYKGEDILTHEKERIRMKEILWSVNAKTGVSYPLVRFLSVYAEVGVGYYFDNGSAIETIRSEKPFDVNLQAGFRLGF